MKILIYIVNTIDFINHWIGRVSGFLIIPLMIIIVYDVFMRYFLNNPTIWALELSEILLIYIVCLCAGSVLLHNSHVRVTILVEKFTERTQAMIRIVLWPVLFLISFILIWKGGATFWDDIVRHSTSSTMWAPPLWISKIMVPVGGLLIGIQAFAEFIRDCSMAFCGINIKSKWVSGKGGITG